MLGTLMRRLILCAGLAAVAPVVLAQDDCWEDECENSSEPSTQEDASEWSGDGDSEQALEEEDDPGCAEGTCATGDESSIEDNGFDPDGVDSGAAVSEGEEEEEEEEEDSGPSTQEDASESSGDGDSDQALEEEDDAGCAEGACATGDESSVEDNGLDPDGVDGGAAATGEAEEEAGSGADGATPTADVPSPSATQQPAAATPTPAPEAVTSAQGTVIEGTDSNRQLLLESNMPVLVLFWAEWCGTCRIVLPALNELAGDYAGRALIVTIKADENPDVASRYGVRSLPAIMLFKGGKVVDRRTAATKSDLASMIDRNL